MGNYLKSPKMDYIVLYQVTEIFRNVNFLQLMKHILNIFSRFGGLIQHLWVSPLWLSALKFKQAAYTSILTKVINGRHVDVCTRGPTPHVARGRKTLQMHGKTSKGHNSNSKARVKNLFGQISNFDPFCVPI